MKYHFKHQIPHPTSQQISDKVSFFADIFYFTLMSYGNPGFKELENHKSLLEKIKFQLDNYSNYSPPYIKLYFSSEYLNGKDLLIKEFYSSDWKSINSLKVKTFREPNNSDYRNNLNTAIGALIEKIDESIFKRDSPFTSQYVMKWRSAF